jgi:hypothetical protein
MRPVSSRIGQLMSDRNHARMSLQFVKEVLGNWRMSVAAQQPQVDHSYMIPFFDSGG